MKVTAGLETGQTAGRNRVHRLVSGTTSRAAIRDDNNS